MGTALSFVSRSSPMLGALLLAACAPSVQVSSQPSVTQGPTEPAPPPPDDPAPVGTRWPAPVESMGLIPPVVDRAESGLRFVAPASTGRLLAVATAQVVLTVPFGSGDGEPGTADLVADAVAENAEDEPQRNSLQSTLAGLGATLSIRVGARSTTFAVEVGSDRWRQALTAMSEAVGDFPETAEQFEQIRQRTVARLTAQFQLNPLDFTIEQLLTGGREGARARLTGIQERTFDEARAHHRLHYRPTGAVVGLVIPGLSAEQVLATAASITAPWRGELRAEDPLPQVGSLPSGIYWSPGDGLSRVAVVVTQPDPWDPGAAELRLLQESTTMSGLGGRLERALDQAGDTGFLFTNRSLVREGRRHLILETTLQPGQVTDLWQILNAVRASYINVPPSDAELQLAADRAYLIAMSYQANPRFWLETAMWQVLRQRKPEPPVGFLTGLEELDRLAMQAAATELQGWPMALVVIGGRPEPAGDLPLFTLTELPQSANTMVTADPATEIAAARAFVEQAIGAVGGVDRLRTVTGYSAVSRTTPDAGPGLSDMVWVATDRLRRQRRVLATTVETIVATDASYELSGDERRELATEERRRILREAQSHPIPLLAACARDEMEFRYVSSRAVGDREMVVLEAVDPGFGRLRVHMDRSSGLLREIESWEMAATGPSYVRETYSDYRSVSGIRVPFHRETELDNGAHRYETEWQEFRPGRPPDNLLGRQR